MMPAHADSASPTRSRGRGSVRRQLVFRGRGGAGTRRACRRPRRRERRRRLPVRRLDLDLLDVLQERVEARAAKDADLSLRHLECKGSCVRSPSAPPPAKVPSVERLRAQAPASMSFQHRPRQRRARSASPLCHALQVELKPRSDFHSVLLSPLSPSPQASKSSWCGAARNRFKMRIMTTIIVANAIAAAFVIAGLATAIGLRPPHSGRPLRADASALRAPSRQSARAEPHRPSARRVASGYATYLGTSAYALPSSFPWAKIGLIAGARSDQHRCRHQRRPRSWLWQPVPEASQRAPTPASIFASGTRRAPHFTLHDHACHDQPPIAQGAHGRPDVHRPRLPEPAPARGQGAERHGGVAACP